MSLASLSSYVAGDYQKVVTSKSSANELKAIEVKIMGILDGHASEYDFDRALLLTHSYGFDLGSRYLLEKSLSTDLLLRMAIESGDERGIFKILRREGGKDPELYVQVLTYFVKKSITSSQSDDDRFVSCRILSRYE